MAYIGNTVENQGFTPAIDYFNGNGVTVTFTLSRPIASVAQVIVAVDNVIQNPSSAFNVVGNSITFTSAPLSGTNNIWVEYTSLITTYQGISQDPTVIGDIRATGGYLAEGDFGNSFIDGAILDYVTGAGRVTVGELDDLIFYHGGTAGRSEMMKVSYAGNSTLVGNLAISGSATIQGLTVGKGGGAVASNTAFGVNALTANQAGGTNNTAIGNAALDSNTTGDANTALGQDALQANTTASENTAVGYQALYANTTGAVNTAVGTYALNKTTTGGSNSGLGYAALYQNTTGQYNIAFGESALRNNTTASNNTAVGYQAGYSNTTGNQLTAIGYTAGYSHTTGVSNTFLGRESGYATTTGSSNTFVGANAGELITTGGKNSILGRYNGNQGGLDIRTASNYIVLSDGDGNPRAYSDNNGTWTFGGSANGKMTSGNNNTLSVSFAGNAYNGMHLDDSTSTSGCRFIGFFINNGGTTCGTITRNAATSAVLYNTTSDYRLKENIAPITNALTKVAQLKPVTWKWKGTDSNGEGFIAHEVQEIVPSAVSGEKDAIDAEGKPIYQGMDASYLVATLTAAIQELNTKVEAQALEIATLKAAK